MSWIWILDLVPQLDQLQDVSVAQVTVKTELASVALQIVGFVGRITVT